MKIPDIEVIKDIPGYKVILKAVLKSQIQQLVEQIASETEEETVVLSANLSDGSISYHGSESGKSFLDSHDEFKSQFLGFCLKRLHKKGSEQRQVHQDEYQETSSLEYPDYQINSSDTGFKRYNRTLRHEPYRRDRGKGSVPHFRAPAHIPTSVHNSDSANNITVKMEHETDPYSKGGANLGAIETQNSLSQISEPTETMVGDKQTLPASYLESSTNANEHVPSEDTYSEQSHNELNSSQVGSDDIINIKRESSTDSETDIRITGMELPSSGFMHDESFSEGLAMLDNSRDISFEAGGATGATNDLLIKQRSPKKSTYKSHILPYPTPPNSDTSQQGGSGDQTFKRYKPVSKLTEEEKLRRREMDRERQRRHRERIKAINFMFQNSVLKKEDDIMF